MWEKIEKKYIMSNSHILAKIEKISNKNKNYILALQRQNYMTFGQNEYDNFPNYMIYMTFSQII